MTRLTTIKFNQRQHPYFMPHEWQANYNGIWPEDQGRVFVKLKELFPTSSISNGSGGISISFFKNNINDGDEDYFIVLNSNLGLDF